MKTFIQIGKRHHFEAKHLFEMHKLRARIFSERMGWDVPLISGMEIDGYDALDPHYMMIRDPNGEIRGCWRMLPTEGLYMLKDTFPTLLGEETAPNDRHIWELSRFAIDTEGPQGVGFTGIAIDAMREIVLFGDRMGISSYVTVTTTAIERLLRIAGIEMRRFSQPTRIGVETAVAIEINIKGKTRTALFGPLAPWNQEQYTQAA